MLAVQGFSIGAEIASRPVDLLTLSEHISLSVRRRSVGQCSQSVIMLFQSLILSGGRDVLKLLVNISSINSVYSEWWDWLLSTPKILDCLLKYHTQSLKEVFKYFFSEVMLPCSPRNDRQFFQWAPELDLGSGGEFLKVVHLSGISRILKRGFGSNSALPCRR